MVYYIIGSILLLSGISYYITRQVKKKTDDYFRGWHGLIDSITSTKNRLYKPLTKLIYKNKPIKIKDYRKIIKTKITNNLYYTFNTSVYKDIQLENKVRAVVTLDANRESFLPYEYFNAYNEIYKECLKEIISHYEKAGYDLEVDKSGDSYTIKIWIRSGLS